jgi:hypothetical protein
MSEFINNREHPIQTLKRIIKQLHAGVDPETVRAQLAELVRRVDSSEIVAMEQQLMAEGMSVGEVQSMCDLHAQVLRDVTAERHDVPVPSGHPVDTFRRENEALRDVVSRVRDLFRRAAHRDLAATPGEGSVTPDLVQSLRQAVRDLLDVDRHYRRKENLLFPMLERHGVTGPSKVMWGKDDEARALVRRLDEALRAGDLSAEGLAEVGARFAAPALGAVEEMTYKEEKVLLPLAIETLTEEEWGEIWAESPALGWCLTEPRDGYAPPAPLSPKRTIQVPQGHAVIFPTGSLSIEQLRGIIATLPVDLTFVDTDDRVRYFSEGPKRIFARTTAIIGRKVHDCHPPKSVHIVDRILSDFKSGRQNVAEFWIQLGGKFVHIRYFAVRDDGGRYLGTLEVTQDLTPLRQLEGERRLLQYEQAPPA